MPLSLFPAASRIWRALFMNPLGPQRKLKYLNRLILCAADLVCLRQAMNTDAHLRIAKISSGLYCTTTLPVIFGWIVQ